LRLVSVRNRGVLIVWKVGPLNILSSLWDEGKDRLEREFNINA